MTLKHQCPECPKTFCSPSKLQRHFLIHTGQKPYSCTVCWKSFRQKIHLKSHLNKVNNKCSFSPTIARKRQRLCKESQTSILQPHSSVQPPTYHHTPVNSSVKLELQCKLSVNAVQDPNKTEVKSDAAVKPDRQLNRSSQCWSICQKSDEQEEHYSKELGSPNLEQNSNCGEMSDCEAIKGLPELSHADLSDLNIVKPETWSENCSNYAPQELITSVGQQRENCHATSKQQRINTSHQCHTCLKCFPSASKLQRHIMTHTGQRPFGCEMCGKRFRQKTHLRVHCRTHLWFRYHKQRSLYINRPPSRIGGYRTRTSADVPVQEMVVHKKEFDTLTCSGIAVKDQYQTSCAAVVQNNDKRESQNKLLPHTLKSSEKGVSKVTVKRTHTVKSIQNPIKIQHRCFQCLKCFQSASKLQRHEMVHTGLKPYKCPTCGKAFRQASHLKTHGRTHCKKKPSKPVNLRGNIRKLKMTSQLQLYSRTTPQKKSLHKTHSVDVTHSVHDDGERVLLCTNSEIPVAKGESLKSNTASNTCQKGKFYMCRLCCKNFPTPYKLSRHLVTHSGIRPYKCTLCSKTFTQRGHLKVHEHRCRHLKMISEYTRREIITNPHTQDKCLENLNDCTELFSVDATTEELESHVGHCSLTDINLSYGSETAGSEWLAVPELSFEEENNGSEKKHRENCDDTADYYSYSFPSELAFEINKLVQNQNRATPPLSHLYDDNVHNVEIPYQHMGVMAISDSNSLLSDDRVGSEVKNQTQTKLADDYWREPVIVFECNKFTSNFKNENDLKQHNCSADVQPKMTESAKKSHCDICFKKFVSPSKLKRHYVVHTGQRPFRCDICGKTFTQASHVRTHRLTH